MRRIKQIKSAIKLQPERDQMTTFIKNPIDIPDSAARKEARSDWEFDNILGNELASRLIREARESGNPLALTGALQSMAKAGRCGGVEVGFVFTLVLAALGQRIACSESIAE